MRSDVVDDPDLRMKGPAPTSQFQDLDHFHDAVPSRAPVIVCVGPDDGGLRSRFLAVFLFVVDAVEATESEPRVVGETREEDVVILRKKGTGHNQHLTELIVDLFGDAIYVSKCSSRFYPAGDTNPSRVCTKGILHTRSCRRGA